MFRMCSLLRPSSKSCLLSSISPCLHFCPIRFTHNPSLFHLRVRNDKACFNARGWSAQTWNKHSVAYIGLNQSKSRNLKFRIICLNHLLVSHIVAGTAPSSPWVLTKWEAQLQWLPPDLLGRLRWVVPPAALAENFGARQYSLAQLCGAQVMQIMADLIVTFTWWANYISQKKKQRNFNLLRNKLHCN